MSFFDSMKEKVGAGIDSLKTGVGEAVDKLPDLPDLPDSVKELKDKFVEQARAWKEEKLQILREFEEEKKNWFKNMIVAKLSLMFDHAMNVASEHFKKKIKDPYMPECIQETVDDLVDGMVPDVKAELKEVILTGFAPDMIIDHGDAPCCCSPLAFFRYNLLPYDRSFWRQLRNPIWWIFALAALVPMWGVGVIVYILLFMILDCKDEFQMQQYIVNFKSLQFINLGILSAILGAVQYYVCISQDPPNCHETAPKEQIWTLLMFVAQVIVVWLAFCFLGSSVRKGGYHYQMEASARAAVKQSVLEGPKHLETIAASDRSVSEMAITQMTGEAETEIAERTRRRMLKFLVYDATIFVICLGLTAWMMFDPLLDEGSKVDVKDKDTMNNNNWKFVMTLFWIKALYGLLSFPFIILKLPVISQYFITHARPTGYNPYGNTVPYLGEEEEKSVPWDPTRTPPPTVP